MHLRLIRSPKNKYPLKGILIKGNSPAEWLCEMEAMHIKPEYCDAYALPNKDNRGLFACLLVFNKEMTIADIRKNARVQSIADKIFISEHTDIYPELTTYDIQKEFAVFPYFFHPETGLTELNETINWLYCLSAPTLHDAEILIPEDSHPVPHKITAYKAVINPESWMSAITDAQTEEEWYKKLPFNMKKLLEGNQKEMERYMAYLSKNPEMALKHAIPLDIMGTSRGKQMAKFIFKDDNWFNRLLDKLFTVKSSGKATKTANNRNTKEPGNYKWMPLFIILLVVVAFAIAMMRSCNVSPAALNPPVVITEVAILKYALMLTGMFALVILFVYVFSAIKERSTIPSGNSPKTGTATIPNIINWDQLDLKDKKEKTSFSFAPELSLLSRIILIFVLCVSLSYLFLPLSVYAGWTNWFTLFAMGTMLYCTYKLLKTNETLLSSDSKKEETDEHKAAVYNLLIYFLKAAVILSYLFTKGFFPFLGSLIGGIVLLLATTFIIIFLFNKKTDADGAGSNGGVVTLRNDIFDRITQQYEKLAQNYIDKKDFSRAAYIYLKLLKSPQRAADTLYDGKQYLNAAHVYQHICKNKRRAAESFEAAKVYTAAIEIYQELNEPEKIGDLYMLMKKKDQALPYYQKVITGYTAKDQYIKASLIYRKKLQDNTNAQQLLLRGWLKDKDAVNCINNYFSEIKEPDALIQEIQNIYNNHTPHHQKGKLLEALKHEYNKHPDMEQPTREIAYAIIAELMVKNRAILKELTAFTKDDKQVLTDIMQYNLYNAV